MSRATPAEKLHKKRVAIVERTARALNITQTAATELLLVPRQQSLRVNPLAGEPAATIEALQELGWQGQAYEWCEDGFSIEQGLVAIRDSQLVAEGKIYIQNAASWLPVLALAPLPGETILDVCAAPGGKTAHIAAVTNNKAIITANDNSRPRLAKLQATAKRLNANISEFTLYDAQRLAIKLSGRQFDKILLDAPCSGEGMMHLDNDKDFQSWSVAQIKRLQQLQKTILKQAWQLLKPGGVLVYSTCTTAPEENEAVIDYALRTLDNARLQPIELQLPNRVAVVEGWNGKQFSTELQACLRLAPSPTIEAFFVAILTKPT